MVVLTIVVMVVPVAMVAIVVVTLVMPMVVVLVMIVVMVAMMVPLTKRVWTLVMALVISRSTGLVAFVRLKDLWVHLLMPMLAVTMMMPIRVAIVLREVSTTEACE